MDRRVVRLIAGREIRDLFRDRRSVALLLLLPILLYPGFGVVGFAFALAALDQKLMVGVAGIEHMAAVAKDGNPPLFIDGAIDPKFIDPAQADLGYLVIVPLETDDRGPLDSRAVDVLLPIPPDIRARLDRDESVTLELLNRDGDERSKLATRRLVGVLLKYDEALKSVRFSKRGLPATLDQPLLIREPKDKEPPAQRASDEIRDRLAKFLPFLLVMWALAGALHPAIDLCAGEKERGTMETLLISPAERNEIVAGKFLAVWGYSTVTAWWNLLWMGGLCQLGAWYFGIAFIRPIGLLWCALLTMPITALLAALCLALGVYARSTKEGQYYLMPLFLAVLPLVSLSLMPNAELSIRYCLIPITGACLLIQKMLGPTPWAEVWPFLLPVFTSLAVCVALAMWWAVRQFHREDVLFRDGDGAGPRGWFSSFKTPERTA